MRRATLLLALLLCACGDPGLRDRSLMGKVSDDPRVYVRRGSRTGKRSTGAQTSVIGLAPDQLAQYYPDDPALVVRFRDIDSVGREAAAELDRVRKALPDFAMPLGAPADVLRRVLKLPDSVLIDPVRPFAFVRMEAGWAAILPTRSREKAPARLRQLDAVYCVSGDPAVVQSYRAGFRKGFYLPGDVSVIATPDAFRTLPSALAPVLRVLGVDDAAVEGLALPCPPDIERLDLAVRLQEGVLRFDLRAAPDRDSPAAAYLERLRPRPSGAVRWLPSRGTAYVECVSPPLEWEALLGALLRDDEPGAGTEQRELFSVRRLLAALGHDVALVLHFVPRGAGSVLLVGETDDPEATAAFLASADLQTLLAVAAGPDGSLAWQPNAFECKGVTVGMVEGNLSRSRLLSWRHGGNLLLSTLAVLSSGPVVAYAAIVGDKLCVAIGPKSRADMELLVEHLQRGTPVDNEHATEVTSLFPQRLAAVSGDLGAIFDGCVEAAPYWREEWSGLRTAALRSPIPASGAVTVEGGALRVALNVRPALVAEAIARLRAHLETK
ncbi:MAG TPA: hypothetical protein VFY93_16580 [Planctomycetota bacterium]|nr:hypothetical protein [Planctomycetota bacterium]